MEEIRKVIEAEVEKLDDFEAKIRLLDEVKDSARTISRALHRERDRSLYESEVRATQGNLISGSSGIGSSAAFGKLGVM